MKRQETHWYLNDPDARKFSEAAGRALRHIPVKVAQKTIDFSALLMVLIEMETPRIIASAQLAAEKQRPPPQPGYGGGATVLRFAPGQGVPGQGLPPDMGMPDTGLAP